MDELHDMHRCKRLWGKAPWDSISDRSNWHFISLTSSSSWCSCFMFQLRRQVNLIYVTGYTISLIAILLSISIFCYFRWARFDYLRSRHVHLHWCWRQQLSGNLFAPCQNLISTLSCCLWFNYLSWRLDKDSCSMEAKSFELNFITINITRNFSISVRSRSRIFCAQQIWVRGEKVFQFQFLVFWN